jgi:hypothetical protein
VVNLARSPSNETPAPAPGDLVEVDVVEATPHSLIGSPRAEAAADGRDAGGFRTLRLKLGSRSADEGDRGAALGTGSARR